MKLFFLVITTLISSAAANLATHVALQSSPSYKHENGGVSLRLDKTIDTHGIKLGHRLGNSHGKQAT